MSHLAGRRLLTLGCGGRVRVMSARAPAQDTRPFPPNEPTAASDLRHRELVPGIAEQLTERGGAVIVVLHDLGLAAAYAHRVAIPSGGRCVAQGSPADVFTASLLSSVYQHEVEVLPHPRTGVPLVVPLR